MVAAVAAASIMSRINDSPKIPAYAKQRKNRIQQPVLGQGTKNVQ